MRRLLVIPIYHRSFAEYVLALNNKCDKIKKRIESKPISNRVIEQCQKQVRHAAAWHYSETIGFIELVLLEQEVTFDIWLDDNTYPKFNHTRSRYKPTTRPQFHRHDLHEHDVSAAWENSYDNHGFGNTVFSKFESLLSYLCDDQGQDIFTPRGSKIYIDEEDARMVIMHLDWIKIFTDSAS